MSLDCVSLLLQSDTSWVLANSPYIVRGMITIAPEAVLTIEAGVQVIFVGRNAGLTANGEIYISKSIFIRVL